MKKENSYSTGERRTIELSRRLDKHDPDAILEALQDGSYFCKVKAMITCAKSNIKSEEIVEAIKHLKGIEAVMFGSAVGEYAEATLHVLNAEEYKGDNPFVLGLIESGV